MQKSSCFFLQISSFQRIKNRNSIKTLSSISKLSRKLCNKKKWTLLLIMSSSVKILSKKTYLFLIIWKT